MNRELLEKPFDPNQIKQREGNFGKMLDYIEGHAVVKRLNDSFDANWSFAILKHEILKETDEVVVLGELSANGIIKTQFGSSRITRARETGEMISLADDLKAAATDSLKKTATLLGVGLHLYQSDRNPTGRQQRSTNNQPPGSDSNVQQITNLLVPLPRGIMAGITGVREAAAVMVVIVPEVLITRAMDGFRVNSTSTSWIS